MNDVYIMEHLRASWLENNTDKTVYGWRIGEGFYGIFRKKAVDGGFVGIGRV